MQSWFTFELDGRVHRVDRADTHETLAHHLRSIDPAFASFTGRDPHLGGDPVVIGDVEGDVPRFRVADANLLLLPMVAGRQVWTPEGIRTTEPNHPVNLALARRRFECGPDRTDAITVLFFEGYYRPDLRRLGQLTEQFDGLVSRSAHTLAIRESAAKLFAGAEQIRHEAAQRAERSGQSKLVWTGRKDIHQDRFTRRLHRRRSPEELNYVDGTKRRFHRPLALAELLRLKREYPEAMLIAGGTSLAREADRVEWPHLISTEGVEELNQIRTTEEAWEIGAAVSLTRVAETIGRECPPFSKIMRRFGSRAIRNRATLGGYLSRAWSSGQLAPLLLALGSRVLLLSDDGERDAPLSQFYEEGERTIIRPGEVIRGVIIPRATEPVLAERGMTARICDAYTTSARRTLADPYVSGAFALEMRDDRVAKASIAYSGVSSKPERAREAEDFLAGKPWTEETLFDTLVPLNRCLPVRREGSDAVDRDYRQQLVITLFQKFFYQHPSPDQTKPLDLAATREFARLQQPFFHALDS